jgi:transcription-repair coupling factor (superfamily II helicase)
MATVATLLKQVGAQLKDALGGLSGCGISVALAASLAKSKGLRLCITAGPEMAEELALDLQALTPDLGVLLAPALEVSDSERAAAWSALLSRLDARGESVRVLIAPVGALLDAVPAPSEIARANVSFVPGQKLKTDPLFERLVAAGYTRGDQAEEPGQFARRGGIIDVFPHGARHPYRVELFGDEIESVRAFDPLTQRSTESLEAAAFALVALDETVKATLLDYVEGPKSLIVIEPARCQSRLSAIASFTHDAHAAKRLKIASDALSRPGLVLDSGAQPRSLDMSTPLALGEGYAGVATLLKALDEGNVTVALFCGNEHEMKLARESLKAQGVIASARLELLDGDIGGGRAFAAEKIALLSLHELLGRLRRRVAIEGETVRASSDVLDDFVDLEPGDHVVHLAHGIARYKGMETLSREGTKGEFLALEFDDGLTLHVPVSNADVVQKYIGARGEVPRLSKYNTAAWSDKKMRAQEAVLKLATNLLEVQALRAQESGNPCGADTQEQSEFEAECPFRDTPDQAKVTVLIKQDLMGKKPMDRLLCGDVGYGKTELAMRAAFKMVQEGRQVAVLVPTTVLAQQHLLVFRERMQDFPVIIELLSRFRTDGEQRKVIAALAEGKVDIVIGTHRLLSEDVQFKELGLVVIDEEQRFGVEHKERLKQLRKTVDLLTLSATPIPRTLHQAMVGLRDISSLTTPPLERHAVITKLAHWNDAQIKEAIAHELARDGQVFFVHNRVYDIQIIAERVQRLCPDARVEIGHGQMAERELEEVMLRFMERKIDVLVCTTIIESGIDVRSANTMFIDQAHMYGLAELHQLRGRVGRFHQQAFCYLLLPDDAKVPELAAKRLQAIMRHSELGAGFKIAMRDLELRGAGNLLGAEQSGHIASIGYDLYCRLLERAVRKLKNQPVAPDVDTSLQLGLDLRLPEDYIPSPRRRLEVYRRMARIGSHEEAEALTRELSDRFGKPPRVLGDMVTAAMVRTRLARLGITSVAKAEGHLKLRALSAPQAHRSLDKVSKSFRVLDETTLALPLRKGLEAPLDQLRFLSNLLQALSRVAQA